jgi:ATP-dependent RNA helicase HelY
MDQRSANIPPPKLIATLRNFDLLPAIVFLPTRRGCDEAASEVAFDKRQQNDPDRQARREEMFREYLAMYPEIRTHKHRKILVNSGVAAHHAGHIPAWKLLVEKMMSAGLLNAIFATSTVAAGVDFPARTVVLSNADARGNDGWRPLSASELQQMTGRAGRRGRDNVGFVVLAPGQFQNPKKIAELLRAKPDPLESQFRATYTSLLNLLDAFGSFEQVREIAAKSFAFRDAPKGPDLAERIWHPFGQRARVLSHFGYLDLENEKVTETGRWLADLRVDRPLLVGEALRRGIFDELKPSDAAGLIAAVAADPERDFGAGRVSGALTYVLTNFEDVVYDVSNVEWRHGVPPVELINYSAAAAAERWAKEMSWDELVTRTKAEEGDLVRLLSRTGEALRQVAGLAAANPTAATPARQAADIVLREPVR